MTRKEMFTANRAITPPQSWRDPQNHWRVVLAHPWYRHLVQIQHQLLFAIHDYFASKGMITISMPPTTGCISSPQGLGSDSLPVEVDLCGVRTYLADSMQFMLEFGCRLHPAGVYYVMPCFRGEPTDQHHLPQFYHAEAELLGQLQDVIGLGSHMVHYISGRMLERCAESIRALAGGTTHIEQALYLNGKYPQCRADDALRDLREADTNWITRHPAGFDLITRAGEAELARRHGVAGILWLTHFDHLLAPFYQAYEEGTGKAMNADLVLETCETVGAGERHSTSTQARSALAQHQVPSESYEWYLNMRDDWPMRTSGLGMGLERYLLWLLRHDDIRDLTIVYRENGLRILP